MKIPGNREQNRSNAVKEAHLWLIPLLGIAFLLWYIKNATCDVVYSDYIRLVNSYLPDVCDPKKFFVADVLTRIPNYNNNYSLDLADLLPHNWKVGRELQNSPLEIQ